MRSTLAARIALVFVTLSAVAPSGCNKSYCDSGQDSFTIDTGNNTYQGARQMAPDSGWRIHLTR